jgi:hypothetical protein
MLTSVTLPLSKYPDNSQDNGALLPLIRHFTIYLRASARQSPRSGNPECSAARPSAVLIITLFFSRMMVPYCRPNAPYSGSVVLIITLDFPKFLTVNKLTPELQLRVP